VPPQDLDADSLFILAGPFALRDDPEEQVLGADVVVVQLQRLAQREFQDLLGPRGERDTPGGLLAAQANQVRDVAPGFLE
jgi:hypothetical protein